MPSNLRYVHETHAHIVSVYRRMILNEDVATALRRKPAPVTVASLTAASLEHLDSVRNPRPVSLPTKSVVKCMEFMAQTDAADLRQHFTSERARDAAF